MNDSISQHSNWLTVGATILLQFIAVHTCILGLYLSINLFNKSHIKYFFIINIQECFVIKNRLQNLFALGLGLGVSHGIALFSLCLMVLTVITEIIEVTSFSVLIQSILGASTTQVQIFTVYVNMIKRKSF